jgi:hypothetical protein
MMTDGFGNSRQHADRDNVVTLPTGISSSVIRAALQRDGGRQPYSIDFGHRHLVEKPPGIRRDGPEVAPLGLRVQRSEGQGRLSGSRDAGENHKRVAISSETSIVPRAPRMRTKSPWSRLPVNLGSASPLPNEG